MSTVRDYYESHHLSDDPLHKALDSIPALNARLPEIRQQMLSCCGAEPSKDGSIRLVVVDSARWDALAAEQAAIMEKLARIEALVEELDRLFEQAEKEGVVIHCKTPRGVLLAEVEWRKQHSSGRTDDWGKPLPTPGDPSIICLLEKANAAWAAASL